MSNVPEPPPFDFPDLLQNVQCPLPYKCDCLYRSLTVTSEEATAFEVETRKQSDSSKWHNLRKHRLTSSKFKRICSRRDNFKSLAEKLLSNSNIQTKQMKFGLENEPVAAQNYADKFGRNTYAVGFVVNPSACHLGCSPDRRVYDPDVPESYGLLEIKCPSKESVTQCPYLVLRSNYKLQLKRTHEYFYQIMGQLFITGAPWCDFFVYCQNDFHCERVYPDQAFFEEMKNKLDAFYFDYFLPSLAH